MILYEEKPIIYFLNVAFVLVANKTQQIINGQIMPIILQCACVTSPPFKKSLLRTESVAYEICHSFPLLLPE